MKKTFLSILTITTLLLIGCSNSTKNKLASDTTKTTTYLTSFFKKYQSGTNAGNEIQKQELYDKREKELMQYIDSFAIFTNIKGTIENIELSSSETKKSKILRYDIEIVPEEYFKLTFNCANIVDNDSLNTDYIYNTIKNISNHSTVYFDGIVSINAAKNIPRASGWDKDLAFSYPKYNFHVIDISTSQLNDTINPNLKASIKAGRKSISYLFQKFREGEKYNVEQFKILSDKFEQSRNTLTEDENKYVQRYINAVFLDLN